MEALMAKSTPRQYPVFLSEEQRGELELVCKNGHSPAKKIRRAKVILLSDHNRSGGHLTRTQISELLNLHPNTVDRIRKEFVAQGVVPTIQRKVRTTPPRPPILDGAAEAKLIAICCSDPPEGRVHWTMELLAQTLRERQIVTQISSETVRRALKKRTETMEEAMLVCPGT
jgi:hypothetical protein